MSARDDYESGQPDQAPSGQPVQRARYWQTQPSHDFTLQAVQELDRTVAVLNDRVKRLREDQKEEKGELKELIGELRRELADFRKDEFKSLSDDVSKMKVHWAKVVGGAAVVGAIVSFLAEIAKAKFGG